MRRLLNTFAAVLLITSTAAATNYYVTPSGDDAASGLSEESAWLSPDNGDLLGITQPGDTIFILPGLYKISAEYHLIRAGTESQPIVYRRLGKGEARIDANYSTNIIVLVEANHIELHGLHLLNAKDDALHIKADSCLVTSMFISAPGRRGIRAEGSYNHFYRNVVAFAGEDGIKNEDAGKFGNRYYHNTIYRSTKHGIEIKGAVEDCRVVNCIVIESGDKGITGPNRAVCAYNNVWGSLNGDYDGVIDSAGGISSPPRFVDPANERFDLKATAAEIDAGLDLGYSYNRTAPDIGAFEKYNTYFVNPTGNDNNDGLSPTTSWLTIDNGDSLLYPGDTVYIMAGIYPDSVIVTDSGLVDDPVVYSGTRDSSVMRGSWQQAVRVEGQYLTISGLSVYGAGASGFYITGESNRIDKCRIDSCAQYGVYIASGEHNTVLRSVLANTGTAAILAAADSLSIWNCTFVNSGDFDIDAAGINGLSVRNSILVAGSNPLASLRTMSSANVRYCEFHSYPTRIVGGGILGTGCFAADPRFLDPTIGVYRLDAASPAIDAGENLGIAYLGPAPDLGAYETGIPVSVTIIPVIDSMLADLQYQFSAEAIDSIGYPAKAEPLLWSHSFSSGTLNTSGLFVPELVDTATIMVEAITYGLADTTELMRVVPGALSKLSVIPSRDTISADSTRLFSVSGFDSKGNQVTDVGNLLWSVLNGIGTVSETGLFSAVKAGNGFVRTISDHGVSGTSDTITVIPGDISWIDVQPSVNIVVQSNSYQYSAFGYDADSNLAGDLSTLVNWSTTDTSGNVDVSGLYTAGTAPSPPVYYVKAEWGGFSDSGGVSVISNGVLSYVRIEYADGRPVIDTIVNTDNDTTTMYARGYDSGDNLLGDVSCSWHILDTDSIGILSPTTGVSAKLELVRPGSGRIVAEYAADVVDTSGIVTCIPGRASSIRIFPDSAISVDTDSTLTFTSQSYDADGNQTDPPAARVWHVTGDIGVIDSLGQFIPETAGFGYVDITAGDLADTSAAITVSPGALVRIQVSPDTAIVSADSMLTCTAIGFDAKSNEQDPGSITWQLTDAVGSIDGSGIFDAVTVGKARIVATSNLGPVDTSAILEVLPGRLNSIIVAPDSIDISTDSTVKFSTTGFDADGNAVTPGDIEWISLNGLSDIDGSGLLNPYSVGIDRVLGRSVVGVDTVADTTTAVVITPGTLDRLSIYPNSATIGIGDSLQFSATGYDRDFNETNTGTLAWSVSGNLGGIDSTGLLIAESSGTGQVMATSAEFGVSESTDLITVEALRIAAAALQNSVDYPGTTTTALFKCILTNPFDRPISINSFSVNSNFTGSGDLADVLSNVNLLRLYVDVDNNSRIDSGDSLISTVPMDADRVSFTFDSVTVPSASMTALLVTADINLFAKDADSLDLFIYPHLDVETTDGTAIDSDDSLNSQGVAVIDGMISSQITLTPRSTESIRSGDSLIYLATLDIPRNGYQPDMLEVITIANAGTATDAEIDSLLLFADDGNGTWNGVTVEQRVAKLVFTGSHWTRSGLSLPLPDPTNRFYLAARFADFGQDGTTVRLEIPQNGLRVSSGNDGPIDGDIIAADSVIVTSDHWLEIETLSLPSRVLVPGENSGPIFGLNLLNRTLSNVTIQQLVLDFAGFDPDGASQSELDSQLDSISLYRAGDADYSSITINDVLLSTAQIADGRIVFDSLGVSIDGGGSNTALLSVCWLSATAAKNGNTIGLGLTGVSDIMVSPATDISASFPLVNPNQYQIDAFPESRIGFTPVGKNTMFGGESNLPALAIHIPANGYDADTLNTLQLTNLGTVNDNIITQMSLYADLSPSGAGPEDSLLTVMTHLTDTWQASNLNYPVPQGGTDLSVTVDLSTESFEGGTLKLAVPKAGMEYRSKMIGPDDSSAEPKEEILVFPSNRVTAVSIPLATSPVYPGSEDNSLITFALYNGYTGQPRHLSRVTLTNTSRVVSDDKWADQSLGQVRLYYDQNRNRVYDDDILIGTGLFEDRLLAFSGINTELPPESLSYFFVVADCPLTVTDSDSLSVAINGAGDLGFKEPVSLNGDIPLTRGGYLVIDGSVSAQYTTFSVPSRSVSPNDSNIVLVAFDPAINGDQPDTLISLAFDNLLDADNSDLSSLELWSDINSDQQWQPTDLLLGSFSYAGDSWIISGMQYAVDTLSKPLIITAVVSDSARSGRAFRGYLPINACLFTSGNDGPIEAPVFANATFTISSSALSVNYRAMRSTYSVGEPITLILEATNRLGSALDSIFSQVAVGGDAAAVVADSALSGPTYIASDGTAEFRHYFSAAQPGAVTFRSTAIAATINDSSAVIESDTILIQKVPTAVELALSNFMPTAVARGQQNVFPLSLQLSHGDSLGAAAIEVRSITLSVLDGSSNQQVANTVFSRLLLADNESPIAVLTSFPATSEIPLAIDPPIVLQPAGTAELVLLIDISESASATSFMLGIETVDAINAVDNNTDIDVAVVPVAPLPLRTASCRIDDPSQLLAVSNSSPLLTGINVGQENAALLGLRLRHPGISGMSQIQVVGLTLTAVSGVNPLPGTAIANRISVYRSTELLGEAVGASLDNERISIDLGSGLTINPDSRDSLIVKVSVASNIAVDSFQLVVADSADIRIRDVVSGSEVTGVTDQEILATGSIFPLTSPTVKVYQPTQGLNYCIANPLPPSVVAGATGISLVSLSLEHLSSLDHSPVRVSKLSVLVLDSSGIPLDPGQLFDRTGYRLGLGTNQYHPTLSLSNGATVFPLSDTGVVLTPLSQMDIELIADIESDCPYSNFQLVLDNVSTIALNDAVDPGRIPVLTAATACDNLLPYQSAVASVFRPAGSPRLTSENTDTKIAYPGQLDLSVGSLELSYGADIERGDVDFTSLQVMLYRKSGELETPAPLAMVFSHLYLSSNGSVIAEDTLFSADTSNLIIDPSLVLSQGQIENISITGDLTSSAPPGNYRLAIVDSTALAMHDHNLGNPVYPVLISGNFPASLAKISITLNDLSTSFSNYPNPFIAQEELTTIAYVLPEDAIVDIEIFTITGEPVTRISSKERRTAGTHQDQTWNGRNDAGLEVVPGTYFCRITARYDSGRTETARRKVSVIR